MAKRKHTYAREARKRRAARRIKMAERQQQNELKATAESAASTPSNKEQA